jgi:hypothetical protein
MDKLVKPMDDLQNTNLPQAVAPQRSAERDAAAASRPPAFDVGVAHRLRGLAEDIAAFVALQNSRLEQAVDTSFNNDDRQREIDRRQAELDARERQLGQRQREAVESVEDECEKLTAAWDELEAQRRQLLAQGAGAPSADAPAQPALSTMPASATPATAMPRSDIDLIGDIAMPATTQPRKQSWSNEPAAQQFQQMKREIRRHARRRKP